MNGVVRPLDVGCRMTVVVPARDEELSIVACLEALEAQATSHDFDVIVFANNCTDQTAERARQIHLRGKLRVQVVEATLPESTAHVGAARRMLMECAVDRFLTAGKPLGIVATTDADTIVARDWVASTFDEMRSVDAVAGLVELSEMEQHKMVAPVRLLYAREIAFRRAWTELESLIDPRPEDPPPRHGAFVGASFAVTAAMYRLAGGLAAIPCLEDRDFLFALRRVDARIRFSIRVRAWTSGRRRARVVGGFGTFIGYLYDQASSGQTFLVEHPQRIVDELEGRAALRRIWGSQEVEADSFIVEDLFGLTLAAVQDLMDRSIPFGMNDERVRAAFYSHRTPYELVPVDEAITELRAQAASRNVWAPTRSTTASGAG